MILCTRLLNLGRLLAILLIRNPKRGGVQDRQRLLEAELEQLHDCCVDLTNRLNAAEARETDLASELARREEEVWSSRSPFPSLTQQNW